MIKRVRKEKPKLSQPKSEKPKSDVVIDISISEEKHEKHSLKTSDPKIIKHSRKELKQKKINTKKVQKSPRDMQAKLCEMNEKIKIPH